jgi:hypothetical protein
MSHSKKLSATILVVTISAVVGVTTTKAALRYLDQPDLRSTSIAPTARVGIASITYVNNGSDGTSVGLLTPSEAEAHTKRQMEEQLIQGQAALRVRLNTPTGTQVGFGTIRTPRNEALLKRIAAAFRALDPRPARRLAHFQWLNDHPVLHVSGWNGTIMNLTPLGDGVWRVEVGVGPTLVSKRGGIPFIHDYVTETWLYKNGQLEYARSQVPDHAPQIGYSLD